MTDVNAPEQSRIPVDWETVIGICNEDPLSKALLERAVFLSQVRKQEEELRYLRQVQQQAMGEPAQGGQRVEG